MRYKKKQRTEPITLYAVVLSPHPFSLHFFYYYLHFGEHFLQFGTIIPNLIQELRSHSNCTL